MLYCCSSSINFSKHGDKSKHNLDNLEIVLVNCLKRIVSFISITLRRHATRLAQCRKNVKKKKKTSALIVTDAVLYFKELMLRDRTIIFEPSPFFKNQLFFSINLLILRFTVI